MYKESSINLFAAHNQKLSFRSVKTYESYLRKFSDFLVGSGRKNVPDADELYSSPAAWHGITADIIRSFRDHLIGCAYSPATVTGAIHIVRKYARLAASVGVVSAEESSKIGLIRCAVHDTEYQASDKRQQEGRNIKRKHSEMIALTSEQCGKLKAHCDLDTPQGRRDFLIICLLLDHAMRAGEVEMLKAQDVSFADGSITFYREKSREYQTIKMSPDTVRALALYMQNDSIAPTGYLVRGSRKNKQLDSDRMSRTAISARVKTLSMGALGFEISSHDLRHTWATYMANHYPDKREQIKQAAGWKSDVMLAYYVRPSKVSNESINVSL